MVNKAHDIHPGLALAGLVVTAAAGAWGLFVLMLAALGCMAAETGSLDGFHQWFCGDSSWTTWFAAFLVLLPVAAALSQAVRALQERRWLPLILGSALALVAPVGVLILAEAVSG